MGGHIDLPGKKKQNRFVGELGTSGDGNRREQVGRRNGRRKHRKKQLELENILKVMVKPNVWKLLRFHEGDPSEDSF